MIGLEAPGPGSGVFQDKFASGDQLVGTDAWCETPAPDGPRKRGQSLADTFEHVTSVEIVAKAAVITIGRYISQLTACRRIVGDPNAFD